MSVCYFFFQAEDGIRDGTVTGVQTCALPIYPAIHRGHIVGRVQEDRRGVLVQRLDRPAPHALRRVAARRGGRLVRSEERRVGKEWRCRWCPARDKKKRVDGRAGGRRRDESAC